MSNDAQVLAANSEQCSTQGGIAYRSFGHGLPLVLLHGNNGSWTHWVRNIGCLSGQRRVLAPDLPGFGASVDVAPDISVDAYIGMVADAVDEMCGANDPIDIVGFSFGGGIAAGTASILHGRLRRLSLLTPSGFDRPTGRVLSRPRRKDFGSSDAASREFHRVMLGAVMLANPASIDELAIDIQASNVASSRFEGSHISWSGRLLGYLGKIERPVQLIYGKQDPMPYPSALARIAACRAVKPSLRVDWVEEAGHWVQYERAEEVNRLLMDFLGATHANEAVERGPQHAI